MSYNNSYPPNYGQPYGGPPQPPPKKSGAGVIILVVVLVVGVLCLGGIGVGIYVFTSSVGTSRSHNPNGGDEDNLAVGDCATYRHAADKNSDDYYLDRAPSCGKGTYKVLARFSGTTKDSKCNGTGSDDTYTSYGPDRSPKYVLCLKKQ